MPCEQYEGDLQAYLDGELAPQRRSDLEIHVGKCEQCREVIEQLRAVSAALARWQSRVPSDKFEFLLQFKLSTENLPSEETEPRPVGAAEGRPEARRASAPQTSLARWLYTGWRPVALLTSIFLVAVIVVALQHTAGRRRPMIRRPAVDMVKAFMEVGPDGDISAAYIYAANASKKAVEADELAPGRVASSEVAYNFLVSMESPADRNAGQRLINMLSSRRGGPFRAETAGLSVLAVMESILVRDLYAASATSSALLEARRFEMQGRLREALARYASVVDGGEAARARLAEGALRLRAGDLDGAVIALEKAAEDKEAVIKNTALALLAEVETARKGRERLPAVRETAKTAVDWFSLGLLEIRSYDFRSAANSFMKAANASGTDEGQIRQEARFRSAWCQKEIGQISTAVYGFRSITTGEAPSELEYSARLLEAVSLCRIGRYEESVAVCRELVKKSPPESARGLEALAYFHKGHLELRHLGDINGAAESLGRVAAGGQGNLSFAAQYLLQSKGR